MIQQDELPKHMEALELDRILRFLKKSKHKAADGKEHGRYKFFTSSNIQSKFVDKFDFHGEYLIFGTGGDASIHYSNDRFSTTADCLVAQVRNPSISTKYIYYYLIYNIHLLKAGFRGAGLKHISKSYIRRIKIIVPKNNETQKKIVSVLEKAELLKQWRRYADELTDDYIRSVFFNMFGDPINNSKKWEKKKLKEFGKIVTGNTPSRKKPEYYGNYIEWIKSDNINTPDIFLTKSQEMLSKEGAEVGRTVPKRSVLVTCIAGSLSCIGNAAISNRDVAFNQQINAIVPNEDVDEFFLYFLILNSKKYIQNYSTKAMKGMVSKSVFESIPFIFPPSELQRKFGSFSKDFIQLREYQEQSKQQINDLFGVLMQKASSGELVC